jgi:lysophospholipase L1-like esterase
VTTEIRSYVALGDSFTEGLDDLTAPDGGYRGWADRFAERLDARQPGLRYANLAVRGKTLRQVADDQVPVAISLRPDLVSIAAGGNDMLRPGADPDTLAAEFDQVIVALQQAGCPVLMFTGFDPRFPVLRLIRGKVAAFNMHLRTIADRHQCHIVDLWSMHVLRDPRAWSADRLHLTADGHRRVALRACEVLGVPADEDWREPWPPLDQARRSAAAGWLSARRMDARWARMHAAPWMGRRIRGRSSGDGIPPKRPQLLPFNRTPAPSAVLDLGLGPLEHSTS